MTSAGAAPSQIPRQDPQVRRLDGWKEIAAYFGRTKSTVERWEKKERLPLHRQEHSTGHSVYAYEHELEEWLSRRSKNAPPQDAKIRPPLENWRSVVLWIGVASCLAAAGWLVLSGNQPGDAIARSFPLATSPGSEWEATLSPDGARVAYIWNGDSGRERPNLYVKPVSGGAPRRLTNGPWRDQFPRWSPDGRWIALGRLKDQAVDILLISPDGAQQRTVAHLESPAYRRATSVEWATWLPDSKSVAIIEKPSLDQPYAIFRLAIDTGERRQLTFPPRETDGDRQCAFSPDGRRLAFVRYRRSLSDIYLASSNGGEATRLTYDRIYHHGLSWTPDSREIIYGAQRLSANWGLWRLKASSGSAQPVRIPGVQEDASWPALALAPGGGALRIAYTHSRQNVNIFRWDDPGRQGTAPRPVCPSTRFDAAVQYSPDGSRIAFVSNREGSREIWVCSSDGAGPLRVTSALGLYTDSPRWSPDGNRLVFSSSIEENREVWIADLRAGTIRRFTQQPSQEGRPSWSSDGRWIYFWSDRSGREEIWKQPVDGAGPAIQLTRTGAWEAFEALDGSGVYFARQRARLGLWSVPTTGGDETFVVDGVREGHWSVSHGGIYFLSGSQILVYPFSARIVEPLAAIPGFPWTGFSARRDGRSFLWSQSVKDDNDIMMLDLPWPWGR